MRVQTQLRTMTLVLLVLAGGLGFAVIYTNNSVSAHMKNYRVANEISKGITELVILTQEYLRISNQRTVQQWFSRHRSLTDRLNSVQTFNAKKLQTLGVIRSELERATSIFLRLIEARHPSAGNDDPFVTEMRQQLLAQELMVASQALTTESFNLSELTHAAVIETETVSAYVGIAIAMILMILAIGILIFVHRSIARPVETLEKDVGIIGQGQLDHRINLSGENEFGNISRAINKMAKSLSETLVSRVELAQRVEQRTRELAETNQLLKANAIELQRSNRELEQFAYIASHDLKSPLRAIDNLAHWILEDLGPQLKGNAREYVELIIKRVRRLDKLLSDLLAYSRIGRKDLTIRQVDSNDLVNQIAETMNFTRPCTVTVDSSLPVFLTAETPLRQVLANLMGNAVKHHTGDHCTVRIACEDDGNWYRFSVRDDGPGIPQGMEAKIFEMFQTLKPRDELEGSGMGLAIASKLVEWQGGELTVENNNPGPGATFHFNWRKHWSVNGTSALRSA